MRDIGLFRRLAENVAKKLNCSTELLEEDGQGFLVMDAEGIRLKLPLPAITSEDEADELATYIADIFRDNMKGTRKAVEKSFSRDYVLKHCCLSLSNPKKVKVGSISKPFPCLPGLMASVVVDTTIPGGSKASYVVTKDMLAGLEMSEAEIYAIAEKNSAAKECRLVSLQDFADLDGDPDSDHIKTFVLTNSDGQFGASVITNSDVLRRVAYSFESNLYIVAPSPHFLLIIPEEFYERFRSDPEGLRAILDFAGLAVRAEDNFLNDCFYFYNMSTGTVTVS